MAGRGQWVSQRRDADAAHGAGTQAARTEIRNRPETNVLCLAKAPMNGMEFRVVTVRADAPPAVDGLPHHGTGGVLIECDNPTNLHKLAHGLELTYEILCGFI